MKELDGRVVSGVQTPNDRGKPWNIEACLTVAAFASLGTIPICAIISAAGGLFWPAPWELGLTVTLVGGIANALAIGAVPYLLESKAR